MSGPLQGIRIIELAGLGPGPFCGMMLADHGADVIRIERHGATPDPFDPLARSRRSIVVDVKQPDGVTLIRQLAGKADGFIEGFRPGVAERLGLGPDVLLTDNPKLVYGRMTGWGQHGPTAKAAGHDINYIALSGVLHTIGTPDTGPIPPVNYVGDFGGGGMMLAFAMVSALLAVRMGGAGDIIDCAMTDGSALLSAMAWHGMARGVLHDRPGTNMLDGGAHFYGTYACADGKFVAVGAIEPQFYALLRAHVGVSDDPDFDAQMDRTRWPALKARLAAIFLTRTRDEWCVSMAESDACIAPVLSLSEAPLHPHNAERKTFLSLHGRTQPAPAPRYAQRPLDAPSAAGKPGADTTAILTELGLTGQRIDALRDAGVVA